MNFFHAKHRKRNLELYVETKKKMLPSKCQVKKETIRVL